jgi:hypothetical protein
MQPISKQGFPASDYNCRFWPDIYVCGCMMNTTYCVRIGRFTDEMTRSDHSVAHRLVHIPQRGLLSCPQFRVGTTVLSTVHSGDYCIVHNSQWGLLSCLQIIVGMIIFYTNHRPAYCLVHRPQWGSLSCP